MWGELSEEKYFFSFLDDTQRVLEYGSGTSTIQISKVVKEIVSIEHQKKWFDLLKPQVASNCTLILKEPTQYFDIHSGKDGTYEQFFDYVNSPLTFGSFDVILIDGRARVACASKCHLLGHEKTNVFIHDNFREEYKQALQYLDFIDSCDTMSRYKIKF